MKSKKKKKLPKYLRNHGQPWTVEDMLDLLDLWTKPRTEESIARQLGRTVGAINVRIRIIRIAVEIAQDIVKTPKQLDTFLTGLANAPGRKVPRRGEVKKL